MDKKKFEEIRAKLLEERKNRPKVERKWPYELFGVECGEGWKGLYQPILDYAMEHNIEVHQVKEKFNKYYEFDNRFFNNVNDLVNFIKYGNTRGT
jgi:hypothetical protein